MKTNAIIRIVIWSLVLVLLVSLLGAGLLSDGYLLNFSSSSKRDDFSGTASDRVFLNPDDVRSIDIEWVAGSIDIRNADVDSIQVQETAPEDPEHTMVWNQKNHKLIIRFTENSTNNFSFGITLKDVVTKDLTILVPRGWKCESLEVDAASAKLLVTDMTISEVDFNGASGTCDFENCDIRELDLDTASGDIRFSGTLDLLDCNAASANVIAVFDNVPSAIDMDSMSGDLDITLPSDAGFTVSMDALSSDFFCEFGYSQRKDTYYRGNGKCQINLDAMSGELYIRERKEATDVEPVHHHTDHCITNPESCPDYVGHHADTHHN